MVHNQVIGKNKLNAMVKTMCEAAGVFHKTKHLLRATSATEMFQAGMPEKKYSEDIRTPIHRSFEANMNTFQMNSRKRLQQYFPPLIK